LRFVGDGLSPARVFRCALALRPVGVVPNLANQFSKLILNQAAARFLVSDGDIFDLTACVFFDQRQGLSAVLYPEPTTVFTCPPRKTPEHKSKAAP
jgi:hypothetical protein